MNAKQYAEMKSNDQLSYLETAQADEIFALCDELKAESASLRKEFNKTFNADTQRMSEKMGALARVAYNRTMVREGKW